MRKNIHTKVFKVMFYALLNKSFLFPKNGLYIGRPFSCISGLYIFTRLDQQVTQYPAYTDVKVISVDTGR